MHVTKLVAIAGLAIAALYPGIGIAAQAHSSPDSRQRDPEHGSGPSQPGGGPDIAPPPDGRPGQSGRVGMEGRPDRQRMSINGQHHPRCRGAWRHHHRVRVCR